MSTVAFPSPIANPPRYEEQTEPSLFKPVAVEVAEATDDTSASSVTYPVVKMIEATFTYIGKLEPTPLPDLED